MTNLKRRDDCTTCGVRIDQLFYDLQQHYFGPDDPYVCKTCSEEDVWKDRKQFNSWSDGIAEAISFVDFMIEMEDKPTN